MKDKTLSEKRRIFKEGEEAWTDGTNEILLVDDVKQFIKEILENQFVKFDFSGSEKYRQGFLDGVKHMKNKIKQKSGFRELK